MRENFRSNATDDGLLKVTCRMHVSELRAFHAGFHTSHHGTLTLVGTGIEMTIEHTDLRGINIGDEYTLVLERIDT